MIGKLPLSPAQSHCRGRSPTAVGLRSRRSIPPAKLLSSGRQSRKTVHLGSIREEADDIAPRIDSVDEGTRDAERGCLRGARGIELREMATMKDKTMHVAGGVRERADDSSFVIAAEW